MPGNGPLVLVRSLALARFLLSSCEHIFLYRPRRLLSRLLDVRLGSLICCPIGMDSVPSQGFHSLFQVVAGRACKHAQKKRPSSYRELHPTICISSRADPNDKLTTSSTAVTVISQCWPLKDTQQCAAILTVNVFRFIQNTSYFISARTDEYASGSKSTYPHKMKREGAHDTSVL